MDNTFPKHITAAHMAAALITMSIVIGGLGCADKKNAEAPANSVVETQAADTGSVKTWACGDSGGNVIATLKDGTTLIVSGTGKMADYSRNTYFSNKMASWHDIKDSITDVVIEDGVTSIGSYTFNDFIRLTSVTIPSSVKRIGDMAFFKCSSMTAITIPNSVRSIGMSAFAFSGLTFVVVPDSVTAILSGVFIRCEKLTSVTLHSRVRSIQDYAFAGCIGLTSITIPNSVEEIMAYAFDGCVNLMSIIIPNRRPPGIAYVGAFGDSDDAWLENGIDKFNAYFKKACLYVPANSVAVYRAAYGWDMFECVKPVESAPYIQIGIISTPQ